MLQVKSSSPSKPIVQSNCHTGEFDVALAPLDLNTHEFITLLALHWAQQSKTPFTPTNLSVMEKLRENRLAKMTIEDDTVTWKASTITSAFVRAGTLLIQSFLDGVMAAKVLHFPNITGFSLDKPRTHYKIQTSLMLPFDVGRILTLRNKLPPATVPPQ